MLYRHPWSAAAMALSEPMQQVDDSWRGKNVLVIGGGNSACDVAVEAARVAERRLQTTSSRFQGNAA
jgi:thioredoxin reductase